MEKRGYIEDDYTPPPDGGEEKKADVSVMDDLARRASQRAQSPRDEDVPLQ